MLFFLSKSPGGQAFGLPYLLIELFYIGLWWGRTVGRSVGRSVYCHLITKFSRMGRLPHFLNNGAPLKRNFSITEIITNRLPRSFRVESPDSFKLPYYQYDSSGKIILERVFAVFLGLPFDNLAQAPCKTGLPSSNIEQIHVMLNRISRLEATCDIFKLSF